MRLLCKQGRGCWIARTQTLQKLTAYSQLLFEQPINLKTTVPQTDHLGRHVNEWVKFWSFLMTDEQS